MKRTVRLVTLTILWSFITQAQQVVKADELKTAMVNEISLSTFNGKPFTGFAVQYQNSGRPISWITYKDGLADGQWQEWYENGNLRFNASWKEGKGHGQWRYYHENGQVRQEEFFDMDIAQGFFRSYWPNGNLQLLSSWLDGKKHGEWIYYDDRGNTVKREAYQNGEILEDKG